ncbi:tryptase-2-like isoform X1 [Monodelphis domestica]|uniref:Serine protease 27-like n=1 Tax=Monodelphis domestica TaxID=13616 RepID=F7D3D3_MONDO|nr:tryptase-2-like isoform X1 [Monodelphis domestica]
MGWVSLPLLLSLLWRVQEHSIQAYEWATVCGQPQTHERILGGQDTTQSQWPWQASLKYKTHHWCGASLIHSSWVLTAAHCFQDLADDPSVWRVQLGSQSSKSHKLSFSFLHARRVSRIILHPYYLGWPPKDIALVKLQSPIFFMRSILPICLPSSINEFKNLTNCWVTGWGKIKENQVLGKPWYLKAAKLPIIDQETCDKYYHVGTTLPLFIARIYDDMLCAGFEDGSKDACQGDSGGPLACEVNGSWHLIGIVSWGDGCGRPFRPSVFTNVSLHTDWILTTINSSTFSLIPSKLVVLLTLQLYYVSLEPISQGAYLRSDQCGHDLS